MAITKQITQAPPAPQRSDPDTFADKADAFVSWLEGLSDELNTWADQANSTADEVNQNADDAEQARYYSHKWATEAEDTLVNDGVNQGYSAYHYALKSEKWYNKVATSQLWVASSSTEVEVGTGLKTFVLNETNRAFTVGSKLRIVSMSDPENIWMEGVVTEYIDNNLTVNIGLANGSGTYSDWKIGLNAGGDVSSVNGYTTSQTPEADRIVVSKSDGKIDNGWVNQGDGSGLDADMLDGYHASHFADTSLSNVLDSIVLDKIKNVDGENSGLDADLVRGLPADFTCNKNQSGYTKLPNGLIIQWGYTSTNNVTFPIVFPNEVFSVVIRKKGSTNTGYEASVNNVSTSGFYINSDAYGYYWIAIGY